MQVILTFDYELFFGANTGSVQKCMIEPTDRLLDLAEKHIVPMVFFVDVGFLIKLFEKCYEKEDQELIKAQLKALKKSGFEDLSQKWFQRKYNQKWPG